MTAKLPIPQALIDATASRHLMLFVGAGISKQADRSKYPSWSELLNQMLERSIREHYVSKASADEIRAVAKTGKLLLAASALRRKVPEGCYLQMLEDLFSESVDPAPIHYTLLRLRPSLIVTTNYDRLIESAFAKEYKRAMTVVLHDDPARVVRRMVATARTAQPFLFKIHGDIQHPTTMVLTHADYQKLIYGSEGYRQLINTLFISHVPLFLGCSFSDPEIADILSHIHMVFGQQNKLAYLAASANAMSKVEIESLLHDFSVHVITYPFDQDHSNLERLLLSLKRKSLSH